MMEPFTWNSHYAIDGPYLSMAFDSEAVLYLATRLNAFPRDRGGTAPRLTEQPGRP